MRQLSEELGDGVGVLALFHLAVQSELVVGGLIAGREREFFLAGKSTGCSLSTDVLLRLGFWGDELWGVPQP